MKHRRIAITALILALLCVLTGCGKDDEEDAQEQTEEVLLPTSYAIGDESIAALTPTDEEAELTSEEPPHTSGSYTYGGLAAPGETAQSYAQQLMSEENGFVVVNSEYQKSAAPDYSAAEGSVHLARATLEEGWLLDVRLDWIEQQCTVTTDICEGIITEKPEPEKAKTYQKMSMLEAVDFVRGLEPESLGLTGGSMDEYEIYVISGAVVVDDQPCMRFKIYKNDNPEQTNEYQGVFFMTADGSHIYRLDTVSNTVTEVDADS